MSLLRGSGRGRDWLRFLLAAVWVVVACFLADRAAHGFTHGAAFPLLRDLFEIFLLLIGFSYMEMAWENVRQPIPVMGLGVRPGAGREFALGAVLGWGMVVAVFLAIALAGHFYVQLSGALIAWRLLVLHIFALAAAALAAEIAFRGYPFQKLVRAVGPFAATLVAGAVFALLKLEDPAATPTAMWISGMAAVMLSVGYLRTRGLWLPWGLHFFWLATVALLFGQPLAGNRQASSVIRSYADGPTWLTGGEYGPAASLIALIVLWIGIVLLFRITRGLGKYNKADATAMTAPTAFVPPPASVPPQTAVDRPENF
jgi:membrane protease YdiL (CAAX protease family)